MNTVQKKQWVYISSALNCDILYAFWHLPRVYKGSKRHDKDINYNVNNTVHSELSDLCNVLCYKQTTLLTPTLLSSVTSPQQHNKHS